jgi:hypothetical protein
MLDMINWDMNDELKSTADEFYYAFIIPNLENFSQVALLQNNGKLCMDEEHYEIFQDSFSEIVNLMEESRLLASLAAAYLQDLDESFQRFRESQVQISMSGKVGALLAGYIDFNHPPSMLFSSPQRHISKNRLMGTWFAGTLIDSAIIRQIAIVDRILAILVSVLNLPIERFKDSGELIYPSANPKTLQKLSSHLSSEDSSKFLDILVNENFKTLKDFRDRFVHRHRVETQLHGDFFYKIRDDSPELFRGLDSDHHLALTLYAHREVILPLIELSRNYLNPTGAH